LGRARLSGCREADELPRAKGIFRLPSRVDPVSGHADALGRFGAPCRRSESSSRRQRPAGESSGAGPKPAPAWPVVSASTTSAANSSDGHGFAQWRKCFHLSVSTSKGSAVRKTIAFPLGGECHYLLLGISNLLCAQFGLQRNKKNKRKKSEQLKLANPYIFYL